MVCKLRTTWRFKYQQRSFSKTFDIASTTLHLYNTYIYRLYRKRAKINDELTECMTRYLNNNNINIFLLRRKQNLYWTNHYVDSGWPTICRSNLGKLWRCLDVSRPCQFTDQRQPHPDHHTKSWFSCRAEVYPHYGKHADCWWRRHRLFQQFGRCFRRYNHPPALGTCGQQECIHPIPLRQQLGEANARQTRISWLPVWKSLLNFQRNSTYVAIQQINMNDLRQLESRDISPPPAALYFPLTELNRLTTNSHHWLQFSKRKTFHQTLPLVVQTPLARTPKQWSS